jgi:hypothetical protein
MSRLCSLVRWSQDVCINIPRSQHNSHKHDPNLTHRSNEVDPGEARYAFPSCSEYEVLCRISGLKL